MHIINIGDVLPPDLIKRRKKTDYVNNKSFYLALVDYQEKLKKYNELVKQREDAIANRHNWIPDEPKKPVASDYIGLCVMDICNHLSYKGEFINYTYRDEMISDAIENCIAVLHSFNPEKSNNTFAYFTRVAYNAMVRRILFEKKQAYIKHKNFEDQYMFNGLMDGEMLSGDDGIGNSSTTLNYDKHNDLISSFENSLKRKKEKLKKKQNDKK